MRFLTVAILALSTVACMSGRSDVDNDRPPPSVLLITLDAVRADRLGLYGYDKAATPTLDALGASGTTWRRAFASTPQSLPSHATLFTGLYPPSHGVRNEGDFALPDAAVTLAERMQESGRQTLAFTSAFPSQRRWGLAQGFDLYHDPPGERPADAVVDNVIATLRLGPDEPRFVWVHLADVHEPRTPPQPWASQHFDGYDAALAFVDAQLGRLLEDWELRYGTDGAYVIVTAPHGEGLAHDGEWTHGMQLTEGALHVPMVARGPGIAAGHRSDAPVSHVDLMPTLLDLLRLRPHDGLQGRDLRYGGSGTVYHEALAGQHTLGLAPLYGWTDADGRWVQGVWGAWHPAMGSWISEQGTRGALDAEHGKRLDALRTSFEPVVGDTVSLDGAALEHLSALGYLGGGDPWAASGAVDPRDAIDAIRLTRDVRTRLDQGRLHPARAVLDELEQRLPDAWAPRVLAALHMQREGRLVDAGLAFEALYLKSPSGTLALQLADLAGGRADWQAADHWYGLALAADGTSPQAMVGRARAAWMMGDVAAAEDRTAALLAAHPDHADAALLHAEFLLAEGHVQAARTEAIRGLEALPWSPWAHHVTGQVLWAAGQPDDALEEMQAALRLDPLQASIRTHLAIRLMDVDRNADAVRTMAPLARQAPDDADVQALYQRTRRALTDEQRQDIRRERAKGPDGRMP